MNERDERRRADLYADAYHTRMQRKGALILAALIVFAWVVAAFSG